MVEGIPRRACWSEAEIPLAGLQGTLQSWPPARKSLRLGENIRNRSILFVDDCITSGTTARLCYEVLVDLGNHVEGLILEATLRIVIVSIGLFTFNMLKLFQIHIPTYYRFK